MADSRLATGLGLAVLAGVGLALAWAIAALLTVGQGGEFETTYAEALPAARVADLVAGVGLIVAGGVAATQPRTHRLGVLAVLAGLAWFGADWEGAEAGSAVLRSAGALVAPLTLVFVLHLALAVPDGRVRSPAGRAAVIGAYALVAVLTIGRALFRDPLLDLYCWRNCADNSFLVHADAGVASALSDVLLWSARPRPPMRSRSCEHRSRTRTGPGSLRSSSPDRPPTPCSRSGWHGASFASPAHAPVWPGSPPISVRRPVLDSFATRSRRRSATLASRCCIRGAAGTG